MQSFQVFPDHRIKLISQFYFDTDIYYMTKNVPRIQQPDFRCYCLADAGVAAILMYGVLI